MDCWPPPGGLPAIFLRHPRALLWQVNANYTPTSLLLPFLTHQSERPLALPHLTVPDIRWVDWAALAAAGFQGCVFDKDNTLTVPYSLQLHPRAKDGLAACMEAFDGRVVLYSNSAGLEQFDPEGVEARTLEVALGVPVLRHREKKPAGGPEDMERHFGCADGLFAASSRETWPGIRPFLLFTCAPLCSHRSCGAHRLVMVGDRYLTDIVFGNRNGMLTVRPAPFTAAGEPKAVLLVSKHCWCSSEGHHGQP